MKPEVDQHTGNLATLLILLVDQIGGRVTIKNLRRLDENIFDITYDIDKDKDEAIIEVTRVNMGSIPVPPVSPN